MPAACSTKKNFRAWWIRRSISGSPPAALPRNSNANSRAGSGVRDVRAGQLRLLGQPAGPLRPHLAQTRRPPAAARRRSHHRRRRISHHGQSDPAKRAGAGICRRRQSPPTTRTSTQLEAALSPRTRAIVLAHTLGNPFDLDAVTAFARRHDLWLIEDCCDAVGSTYRGRNVGTFRRSGDRQLLSRPSHHHGRRRRVLTNSPCCARWWSPSAIGAATAGAHPGKRQHLRQALRLATGRAAPRLRPQVHLLAHRLQPEDHGHAGRRRRGATWQSCDGFIEARRAQFRTRCAKVCAIWKSSSSCPKPRQAPTPSWFGFPLAVRPGSARFHATRLTRLPGGAQDRHAPALRRQPGAAAGLPRLASPRRGSLENTDFVMDRACFWIGVYPGLTRQCWNYMLDILPRSCSVDRPRAGRNLTMQYVKTDVEIPRRRSASATSLVGDGHPCFIIAEIGINHNGDIDLASGSSAWPWPPAATRSSSRNAPSDVVYSAEELAKPRESPFGTTNGDLKRGLEFGHDEYRLDRPLLPRSQDAVVRLLLGREARSISSTSSIRRVTRSPPPRSPTTTCCATRGPKASRSFSPPA